MNDNIILFSISKNELETLIRTVIHSELTKKKEKELMNTKELCAFLGVHLSTVNKWKAEGTIKFKRLGKRIFFDREEVLSSLKEDGNYKKMKELK